VFSIAEGKKNKAALEKHGERIARQQARAHLVELRAAIRRAKADRKEAMRAAVLNCRALRLAARDRARDERKRAAELLKQAARDDRAAALHRCREGKRLASSREGEGVARARLAAEREFRREMRRAERGNRIARLEQRRSTAAERRSESDDEVRGNIPPELVHLFNKVRRSIKGNTRKSRTEAFLQYAEENPGEIYAAHEDGADRLIAELEAKARHEEKALRATRKKKKPGGGGGHVPF
jgi:hypothetical protein